MQPWSVVLSGAAGKLWYIGATLVIVDWSCANNPAGNRKSRVAMVPENLTAIIPCLCAWWLRPQNTNRAIDGKALAEAFYAEGTIRCGVSTVESVPHGHELNIGDFT